MSHHIVHLLSPSLRVRMRLDQLHILDREKDVERTVPLRDISLIICASPDTSFTGSALRRAAELGVVVLICDEKFQPACLTVPYFRATSSDLPRRQAAWPLAWRAEKWRAVIAAKIANQSCVVRGIDPETSETLREISKRCAVEPLELTESPSRPGKLLASLSPSQRDSFRSWSPDACESRAARLYWQCLLPHLEGQPTTRQPGTRSGINGMLDYGYAVLRAAVLRSLAAHGFIAALGIHHTTKPGGQPLADDLMEPLRPFCDQALVEFCHTGSQPEETREERMKRWIPKASALLLETLDIGGAKVRLLNAIDLYVQSFANACLKNAPLRIPKLSAS